MIIPPIIPLFSKKKALRLQAAAERRAAAKARPDAGVHAARNFLNSIPLSKGCVISLFYPIRDEIDTWPLAEALAERGHPISLPVTVRKSEALIFRSFKEGDPLVEDRFGVMTPAPSAAEITPSVIVAPLLAFTRHGDRLGYGSGFYDRTIAKLRTERDVLAVGYAYGAQEVDALPHEPHDQRLDWVVTEREAFAISGEQAR